MHGHRMINYAFATTNVCLVFWAMAVLVRWLVIKVIYKSESENQADKKSGLPLSVQREKYRALNNKSEYTGMRAGLMSWWARSFGSLKAVDESNQTGNAIRRLPSVNIKKSFHALRGNRSFYFSVNLLFAVFLGRFITLSFW